MFNVQLMEVLFVLLMKLVQENVFVIHMLNIILKINYVKIKMVIKNIVKPIMIVPIIMHVHQKIHVFVHQIMLQLMKHVNQVKMLHAKKMVIVDWITVFVHLLNKIILTIIGTIMMWKKKKRRKILILKKLYVNAKMNLYITTKNVILKVIKNQSNKISFIK